MRKILNSIIILISLLYFSNNAYAKKITTIWFVADIGVGLEQWVDDDGSYKYYNYRPHWVELRKSYNYKIFKDKQSCETELLKSYSSVWRSGNNKTIVDKRDPKHQGTVMSDMMAAEQEGFFTTKQENWGKEIVKFKNFFTCGSKSFVLEDVNW